MHRRTRWTSIAISLFLLLPIHAEAARPTRTGDVLLPSSPGAAREMYMGGFPNGLTGYVIDLGSQVPGGTPYDLIRLAGHQAITELDVWFYRDIQDETSVCSFTPQNAETQDGRGGESYRFTCSARWAIVVLFNGASARFHFAWG